MTKATDVVAGQTLFVIDPREHRANASAVERYAHAAQATRLNARQDVERYQGVLVKEQAISQQEFDAAMARLRTAEADVAQTQAQLESAQLNLVIPRDCTDRRTRRTRPGHRKAPRSAPSGSDLAHHHRAARTRSIVNFSQSSAYLLAIRREFPQARCKVPELGKVTVTLLLEDGSPYRTPVT